MEGTLTTLPNLIDFLRTRTRSGFAQSLVRYYERNGRLTPAQEAAARGMYEQAMYGDAARTAVTTVLHDTCGDTCDHGNEDEARMVADEMAAADTVTEPGFYLLGEQVYKVKRSQAGHLYAMLRVPGGWEYQRGAITRLTATHKVTPEVAAQYGAATGICIFCNAELDDADGLGKRVGVGPVCCRRHLGMTQRQLAARLGV